MPSLTLSLPFAHRAPGKFCLCQTLAPRPGSCMCLWSSDEFLPRSLSSRLDMLVLYLIPHCPCRQEQCGGGALRTAAVEELWPLWWLVHHYGGRTGKWWVQTVLVVKLWDMWWSCIFLGQGIAWVVGSENTGHFVINCVTTKPLPSTGY